MIRKCVLLFCDNEHGFGEVTFPDVGMIGVLDIHSELVKERPVSQLRKDAKKAGWGRVNGGDYCPSCMESGV